jgi:hypothetical protein
VEKVIASFDEKSKFSLDVVGISYLPSVSPKMYEDDFETLKKFSRVIVASCSIDDITRLPAESISCSVPKTSSGSPLT